MEATPVPEEIVMGGNLRIRGGVAVITGAASGIGTGLAHHAASLGMRVVLADLNATALEELVSTLDGDALAVPTDVTDPDAVAALAERAWSAFGEVDLLFNNAGVMATGLCWEIEPRRWMQSFDVNVHGVLHGLRAFVPRMLRAGRRAHIVNTASVGGFLPSPMMAPYTASKFAVVALTESLHGELTMLGAPISVSLLAPGPVRTRILDDPFDADTRPAVREFVDMLRQMLAAHGLSPYELARRAFEGIDQGRYWLIPQPEALDGPLALRTETILGRVRPPQPVLPSR